MQTYDAMREPAIDERDVRAFLDANGIRLSAPIFSHTEHHTFSVWYGDRAERFVLPLAPGRQMLSEERAWDAIASAAADCRANPEEYGQHPMRFAAMDLIGLLGERLGEEALSLSSYGRERAAHEVGRNDYAAFSRTVSLLEMDLGR